MPGTLPDMLPVILPLAALQLILMIIALVHLIKHPKVRRGNFVLWLIIIICVNTIGPILYFLLGKGDE